MVMPARQTAAQHARDEQPVAGPGAGAGDHPRDDLSAGATAPGSRFAEEGIKTNCTLVFSTNQGFLAAKAGASLISPFVGRLDDIGAVGMDLIRDICEIYRNYGFKTQVLAASIRNPLHVVDAAKAGAHVATMPFNVLEMLMKHPLTDIGLKKFLDDWAKLGEKI